MLMPRFVVCLVRKHKPQQIPLTNASALACLQGVLSKKLAQQPAQTAQKIESWWYENTGSARSPQNKTIAVSVPRNAYLTRKKRASQR